MLKQTDVKITQYMDEESGALVNVIETEDEYEAWYQQEDHSDSVFMFGVVKNPDRYPRVTKDMFLESVQEELPEYLDMYDGDDEEEDDIQDLMTAAGTRECLNAVSQLMVIAIREMAGEDPYLQKLAWKAFKHTVKEKLHSNPEESDENDESEDCIEFPL